jgi:hypothetical protein
MPAPAVVATGAVAAGTTTITPALPAGIVTNDILLLICESVGGQSYNLPTSWAHVTGSPVVQSTNTQLTVMWRRWDGAFAAPALTGTTDHALGRMLAVRGCPTTGNPWNVVSSAVEALSDTTAVWPGVTTTTTDTQVLEIICTDADPGSATTTEIGALTNATYTSITEWIDNGDTTGNGGVIGVVSGAKATAGATGGSTMTLARAGFKAMMTLAMINAANKVEWRQPSPRPSAIGSTYGPYNVGPQSSSSVF